MCLVASSCFLLALSASAPAADGTFSTLGSGVNGPVFAIAAVGADIYVGGVFSSAGGVPVRNLARWDGSQWHAVGTGTNGDIDDIRLVGSFVYIGGSFTEAGGIPANAIARWDGVQFQSIGSGPQNGVDGFVRSFATDGTSLYVGGTFQNAGGQPALRVARLDGSTWTDLGGTNNVVERLIYADGALFLGGYFGIAGGVSTRTVARYSGGNWSGFPFGMLPPGGGAGSWTGGLVVQGGEVYAGGYFDRVVGPQPINPPITIANYIARWDGSQWTTLSSGGQIGMNNAVQDLGTFAGELIATGLFSMAGATSAEHIARRSGGVWKAMGAGLDAPGTVLLSTPTALYVGGEFTQSGTLAANHILRWTSDGVFGGGFEAL